MSHDCEHCHAMTHIETGDDQTPLCHDCAHAAVEAADQLAQAAETALRQWASYASDNDGDDLEDATHAEGSIYRSAKAALSNYRKVREGL